jgi:hypothetical protein
MQRSSDHLTRPRKETAISNIESDDFLQGIKKYQYLHEDFRLISGSY